VNGHGMLIDTNVSS